MNASLLETKYINRGPHVTSTYHGGLTTRSQFAAVASATVTLFVVGQLVLRWLLL
ncbi:MAG: hypothetical protein R3C10_13535 [Pirellulales bacterium]|nr:hypothetical protein [Planctomycetales bacterium]